MDEKWEVQPQSDLDQLIDRISQGESVELTREGKTVARIVPAVSVAKNADAKAAMEKLLSLNFNLNLVPGETIKDLINEGREH